MIAVPFRLLEKLPDYLENKGPNQWQGEKSSLRFSILTKPGRFDLLVENSMTQFVEKHTIQTRGIPDLSPWSLLNRLQSRLDEDRSGDDLFIGDLVSQLHLLRSTSALASDFYESAASQKALEAFHYVAHASGLPADAELRLSIPFELWSEKYSEDQPLWSAYCLPSAFNEFPATMVTHIVDGRLIDIRPASVSFAHTPDYSEIASGESPLSDTELDELDIFAKGIRERLQGEN